MQTFKEKVAKLSPKESAAQWLALFDRGARLVPAVIDLDEAEIIDYVTSESPMHSVFLALPPPDHWPELVKAIESRQPKKGEETVCDLGLRLLAGILSDDVAARKKVVDELRAAAPASTDDPTETNDGDVLAALLGDEPAARDPVAAFEKQLEERATEYGTLPVPDLVSLVGKDKAEALLTRAMTKTSWTMEVPTGDATPTRTRTCA